MLTKLFTILILFGSLVLTNLAQQKVDQKSLDAAIKTIQKETIIPLKLPTFFPYSLGSSAKQRRQPVYAAVLASDDSFELDLCFSKDSCHGWYFYAEISAEKITPQTERTNSGKHVKLARGITGYFSESSCGSSCAPDSLSWDQDGYRYIVFLDASNNPKTITKFVNSAINNPSTQAKSHQIKATPEKTENPAGLDQGTIKRLENKTIKQFAQRKAPPQSKSDQKSSALDFPFYLDLENGVKDRFKEFYGKYGSELITEKFYPIGWSKTGKFAYVIEPADEACGCYLGRLVILDLKTDQILWEYDFSGGEGSHEIPDARKVFWRPKQAMFTRKLKEHGIQPSKQFELLPFPISYQTDEIVSKLEIFRAENSELSYPHNVSRLLVTMTSKQKGEKTIFQQTFKERDMVKGVLQGHLFGYFASPFEPRVALVGIEVLSGYEGAPHITQTRILGANLVNGFKK